MESGLNLLGAFVLKLVRVLGFVKNVSAGTLLGRLA
jgi:hypothetical protein